MTLEELAVDLLEAAYQNAQNQDIEGRLVLVFQDRDAAKAVGLIPDASTYREVDSHLIDSGAVEEIIHPRYEGTAEITYYEMTPRGVEILREAGRIT
jgi:hypothetical protein